MTQTAVELLRKELDAEIKLGTKMVVNWDMTMLMYFIALLRIDIKIILFIFQLMHLDLLLD